MVFRRRDTRPVYRAVAEALWPRGGWARAAQYVQLRLRRLPGTPEEIARGIFAGAVTVFTPFYGLHFIFAAILAKIMQGRILAALLATFIGNPLTYIPIAIVSLRLGYFMLGIEVPPGLTRDVFRHFRAATRDLWHNFKAIFSPERAHWDGLVEFWHTVFFPWMVGGIVPGIVVGLICYVVSVPLIRAYQTRRYARLRKKMEKLRSKAGRRASNGSSSSP
ncbi:MAG: DUF2062 domain-containing protein [Pseudomonadota bacterium]